MFAQVVPTFQISKKFSVMPSVYGGASANGIKACDLYQAAVDLYQSGAGKTAKAGEVISSYGITANPTAQGVVAFLAVVANVICIAVIIKRSIEMGKNPYSNDVWAGTKDYEEAMQRAE